MSISRPFLIIGMDPLDPPPAIADTVPKAMLIDGDKKIRDNLELCARNGFPYTIHWVDWRDVDSSMTSLQQKLGHGPKEGGQGEWAAVIIGAGLRQNKDPSMFEKAVDAVRKGLDDAKTHVPILFNDGVDGNARVLERWFGVNIE